MKKLYLLFAFLLATVSSFAPSVNAQATPAVYLSAASNNSTLIAAGARTLYSVTIVNTTATVYYVRFYNAVAAPTCSSATGVVLNIPVPVAVTGGAVSLNVGFGLLFDTGLGFCITAGAASNDNTNAATGVHLNVGYQ